MTVFAMIFGLGVGFILGVRFGLGLGIRRVSYRLRVANLDLWEKVTEVFEHTEKRWNDYEGG